ncbi:hypothetical protein [Streptosporangium sp. 'caverna']|uniref:hypothetical protein n=1 Tax=Streptosporangium sp. 'caverna' TaxID=2202249 RepID=UPI0013A6DECD|nr:hypothetical protein [Streptosporangium sp. 'caverna']
MTDVSRQDGLIASFAVTRMRIYHVISCHSRFQDVTRLAGDVARNGVSRIGRIDDHPETACRSSGSVINRLLDH